MSIDNTKNFAKVTVSTGYSDVATTVVLTGGHGSRFPTAPFNATWWNSSDYGDPSDDPNVEIVRVTNIATDTLTVTRAQEGTSASTKNTVGKTYKMVAGLTAKTMNQDVVRPRTLTVVASNALDTTHGDYFCDGTEDEVQINQAVAALSSTGGTIILSEGTFYITEGTTVGSGVALTSANVELKGQGRGTVLSLVNAADVNVLLADAANVTIRDITVNGNMANQSAGALAGIYLGGSATGALVENCYVYDTDGSNIFIDGPENVKILNNECFRTKSGSGYGNIEGGGSYAIIKNNYCWWGDYGVITLYYGSHIVVDSNVCLASNTQTDETVYCNNAYIRITNNYITTNNFLAPGLSVTNNRPIISNNLIEMKASAWEGVRLAGVGFVFSSNQIYCYSTYAATNICVKAQNGGGVINGNYFAMVSTAGPTNLIGLQISYNYIEVSGNNFLMQGDSKMTALIDYSGNNNISNNFFYDYDGSHTGIDADSFYQEVVTSNVFVTCLTAIKLTGSMQESVLSNNLFYGSSSALFDSNGFYIRNSSITGNVFTDCGNNAINIRSTTTSTHVIIANNTFRRISHEAIKLENFSNSVISNNTFGSVLTTSGIGRAANNVYSCILLTSNSGGFSQNNSIMGNTFRSADSVAKHRYAIREYSSSDGPNMIIGNVCQNAVTYDIMTMHGSSDSSHNIVDTLAASGTFAAEHENVTLTENVTLSIV